MFNVQLKKVHVGDAIRKRVEELGLTKTEFGKRIGVQQQHINRIFERETMETKKLVRVCEVLDFNFFALFCEFPSNVSAYLSAVTTGGGNASLQLGETACLIELEKKNSKIEAQEREIELLQRQIELQEKRIEDKDNIITLLKK